MADGGSDGRRYATDESAGIRMLAAGGIDPYIHYTKYAGCCSLITKSHSNVSVASSTGGGCETHGRRQRQRPSLRQRHR